MLRMQWRNRRRALAFLGGALVSVMLTGCGPEVTNLNTGSAGGSSSSSSSGESNTCILGQSKVGNCVIEQQ